MDMSVFFWNFPDIIGDWFQTTLFTRLLPTPSFGTRGSLILDIAIVTYSIHQFLYLFSLLYSTGEPMDVI